MNTKAGKDSVSCEPGFVLSACGISLIHHPDNCTAVTHLSLSQIPTQSWAPKPPDGIPGSPAPWGPFRFTKPLCVGAHGEASPGTGNSPVVRLQLHARLAVSGLTHVLPK